MLDGGKKQQRHPLSSLALQSFLNQRLVNLAKFVQTSIEHDNVSVGDHDWKSYPPGLVGDIPGITSKIDYMQDLEVDIMWLSPMYNSPQHDMGYDVRDYESVYASYGTIADILESRSSRDNPKRDCVRSSAAAPGNRMSIRKSNTSISLPRNSQTSTGRTRQPGEQSTPLQWSSGCRKAWMASESIPSTCTAKALDCPTHPSTDTGIFEQPASSLFCNGPRTHEFLREMNTDVLSKYDTMTVGELPHTPDPAHVL
ncbi:hypothetical protein LZ554_009252 [Drepanopeziza brunnea f. sp. 'monogermtubi']|nr:hypothetical protein LZ554_009252 [Drepanopeziza brunnea f. sp. 'monogermtubi']